MQYYVLGGYSGNNGGDFFAAKEYGELEIERIADPEGGSKTEMPTAVPSPFARFDLVETAFKNIIKNASNGLRADSGINVTASRDDERLVSHTLDLAEIVFNHANYAEKMEILTWRKADHLTELKNGTKEHKNFAESLELYLEQDMQAYNFDRMDNVFLFKYDHDNIIGSTSPVTLFCPSAANLSKLGIKRSDQSIAFGDDFKPLYERSFQFQRWFYFLLAVYKANNLSVKTDGFSRLDCIGKYADESQKILASKQNEQDKRKIYDAIAQINNIASTAVKEEFKAVYSPLYAGNSSGSIVEVLGIELSVRKEEDIGKSLQESAFVIKSEKYKGTLPLVLQDGFTRSGFLYATKDFKPNTPVPSFVEGSWKAVRAMPDLSIKGYYLTVSDFLEPYLVKTIYPISENFYAGGPADKDSCGYLLPLKRDFFEFFDVEDLKIGGVGKPQISIVPLNDGDVKVTLKIPIKKEGEHITFERLYKKGKPDQRPNQTIHDGGIIIERKFGITLFPFIKTNGYASANYRVQLVDADKNLPGSEYSLRFYSQSDTETNFATNPKRRFNKKLDLSTSDYYEIPKEFDFIQLRVSNPEINALIIPNWPYFVKGADKFTFAVDFGTTNTYIAYKKGNNNQPIPFNISGAKPDIQIATLFDEKNPKTRENLNDFGAMDVMELIDKEFVPRKIGKDSDSVFAFPLRTAIAYNPRMSQEEWDNGLDTLTEANIPFGYEKTVQAGNAIDTNLKWNSSGDPKDQHKTNEEMGSYLEQLVMLMQAKVLSNGGSLEDSSLIWFYPNSMTPIGKRNLESRWKEYFSKYFFKNGDIQKDSLIAVTESLAPFYAQQAGRAVNDGAVVSIDIGGGTTDAAVFLNAKLKGTTSFKFAGNALFGDGYSKQNANENGFVIKFAEEYKNLLSPYRIPKAILEESLNSKKAADINAFLFSVENTIEFWAKNRNESVKVNAFSYSKKLEENHDLKFLILYFYVSLIYHISQILKNIKTDSGETIELRYLMFSGTGSKILKTLADDDLLTDLTRKILGDAGLKAKYLEVNLVKEPKEATSNGGLMANIETIRGDIADSRSADKFVYTCIKGKEFERLLYSDYENNIESIRENLIEFHKFFFELNKHFNFSDYFGIPNYITEYVQNNYEDLLGRWLGNSVKQNKSIEGIKSEDEVSETPFFMPLKSIILELSKKIAEGKLK